jgi:hypothetical protein
MPDKKTPRPAAVPAQHAEVAAADETAPAVWAPELRPVPGIIDRPPSEASVGFMIGGSGPRKPPASS